MNAITPNTRSAASLSVSATQLSAEALASVHEHLDAWLAYEAPEDDPLPVMIGEYERTVAAYCLLHDDDAQRESLLEAYHGLECRICTTPAVTPAGLLAQAEFVRERVAEEYGCGPNGEDKRADHERGVDTIVEGLRHLLGRPASITAHLTGADTDPLPELVAEWKRRRALEPDAETEDEIEASGNHTDEMDRPICFAKPQSAAGLKAQAEFIRHQ